MKEISILLLVVLVLGGLLFLKMNYGFGINSNYNSAKEQSTGNSIENGQDFLLSGVGLLANDNFNVKFKGYEGAVITGEKVSEMLGLVGNSNIINNVKITVTFPPDSEGIDEDTLNSIRENIVATRTYNVEYEYIDGLIAKINITENP